MFKDIDVRMKEFAKGMDQNNKTLATILVRFLNPNATIPDSFGVSPSTLSHSHFIHSSPSIVTNISHQQLQQWSIHQQRLRMLVVKLFWQATPVYH